VEEAIKAGIVDAQITGKGGYQENCIKLTMKNIGNNDTLIRVEPGRRLVSDDTTIQNILIIKELLLFLKKGESITTDVYGFCCQAHKGAPYSKSKYNVGFMEDSSMIKLAEFFNKNEYPVSIMQNSVWCLSDGNSMNSIYSGDVKDIDKMKKLYKFIANLKGEVYEFPWYTLTYLPSPERVFSGNADKLHGEINYTLSNYATVDITIRDEKNIFVENIVEDSHQDREAYTYKFVLNVKNYKKGKYFLRVFADNQQILIKEFKI
jgi:hypothetical protein